MESGLLSSSSSTPYLDLEEDVDFLKTSISWDEDPETGFIGPEDFGLSYDGAAPPTLQSHKVDKLEEYRLGKRTASGSSISSVQKTTADEPKKLESQKQDNIDKKKDFEEEKEQNLPAGPAVPDLTSQLTERDRQSEIYTNNINFQDSKNETLGEIKTLKTKQRNSEVNKKQILKECGNKDANNNEGQEERKNNPKMAQLISVYSQTFPVKAKVISKQQCFNSFWKQENSVSMKFPSETGRIVKVDAVDKVIDNEIEKIRQNINTRKFFRSWVWEPEVKVINNYLKKEIKSEKKRRQQYDRARYCTSGKQSTLIKGQPGRNVMGNQKKRVKGGMFLSSSLPVINTPSTGTRLAGIAKNNKTVDDLIMKYRRQHTELLEEGKRRQKSLRVFYDNSMKITKPRLQQRCSK